MAVVAFVVYWLSNRAFDAYRGDLFYLADSFLHGRTSIDIVLGPNDVIYFNGLAYVPFAPFPAIVLMPLVALTGPVVADQWESGINAALAAGVVLCAWWVAGRIGATRIRDRLALVVLLGFSTQIWWVTTRGGVWHTGHLIATIITLLLLAELFGRRRALLLGLLVGAAFLTRAPLAFAAPAVALWLIPADWTLTGGGRSLAERIRALPWRAWIWLAVGLVPALAFFFWYNLDRFGTPLESGYALATLPDWLQALRAQGLFSTTHVGMNFDYLFLKVPQLTADFPWFRPDGLGMSVLDHEPGAPARGPRAVAGPEVVAPAAGRRPRPDPDPALLRRRLAPVRLPLLPRLDPVRLGPRGPRRPGPGLDRVVGLGAHPVGRPDRPRRRVLGVPPVSADRTTCRSPGVRRREYDAPRWWTTFAPIRVRPTIDDLGA